MTLPAFGAQPSLTPRAVYLQMVRDAGGVLQNIATELEARQRVTADRRSQMQRRLAGVVASVETVRLALEKGRMR